MLQMQAEELKSYRTSERIMKTLSGLHQNYPEIIV